LGGFQAARINGSETSKRMNGIARFVLSGGLIVATAQLIAGPLADWNARRDAAAVSSSIGLLGASGQAGNDGLTMRRGFLMCRSSSA
jgi:hypothetical protein